MTEEQIQRALDEILPRLASSNKAKNDEGIKLFKNIIQTCRYSSTLKKNNGNISNILALSAEKAAVLFHLI